MHFFIDETGSFAGLEDPPSLSLVGSLTIPDSRLASLEREYLRLRPQLPDVNGEVKGRLLSEAQVNKVAEILFHHSVIFTAIGIDLGTHSTAILKSFQQRTAEGMTEKLTDDHQGWIREQALTWRKQYEALSLPLVVQTQMTFQLAKQLIDRGTMYFSQRRPEELGRFNWVIDAKGDNDKPTNWEQWWSEFVMPWLQNDAIHEPFKKLPIGDYSHMTRFEGPLSPLWREIVKARNDAPAISLDKVLGESIRFSREPEPGLELVDIITNGTRRALVGNLGRAGWINIPRLMLHTSEPHYVTMISFQREPKGTLKRPYAKPLLEFSKTGRQMLYRDRKW